MDDLDAVLPLLPSLVSALVVVLTVGLLAPPRADVAPVPVRVGLRPPRAVAVAAALAVVAALAAGSRFGPPGELDNPVPALVVGLGPLLLLLLPLLATRRARSQDADPSQGTGALGVWPAVLPALALAGYLSAVPGRSAPPRLGAALAACVVVAVAVVVAAGRPALRACEPVSLLAAWSSLGPRLVRWSPPPGAPALLAVVLGAAWSERWSRSEAWARVPREQAELWLLLGGSVLLAAALAAALQRLSGGAAAAVLLPLVTGVVVAAGLRRALISGQLLLQQAGLRDRVEPDLLGIAGGQLAALSVVAVAGSLAAVVAARRCGPGPDRLPLLAGLLAVTAVSSWVVLQP